MENETISLPSSLYEKLESEKVEVIEVNNKGMVFRALQANQDYLLKWYWYVVPTVFSSLFYFLSFIVYSEKSLLSLYGSDYSISEEIIWTANSVTLLTFLVAYLVKRKEFQLKLTKRTYWLALPIVLLAWVFLTTLLTNMGFFILSVLFYGVLLNEVTAFFVLAPIISLINYSLIALLNNFSVAKMTRVLSIAITAGVISSIVTSGKEYWWKTHFSVLGSGKSNSNVTFNVTLLVVGLLLAILFDYLITRLKRKFIETPIRFNILRGLLIACSLSISAVALPNDGNRAGGLLSQLHNLAAGLIVLFLVIVMVGIFYFLQISSKEFKIFTYGTLVALISIVLLFYTGRYISLTSFELMSFSVAFVWVFSLISTLNRLIEYEKTTYDIVELK